MNKKQILEGLTTTGISETSAELLIKCFHRNNQEEIISDDYNTTNLIFKFLLQSIAELKEFESEVSIMLSYLGNQEATLNDFDFGRLMHLKALKAWKMDNDAYWPLFYLNRSIETLKSCDHPEAKNYLPRVWDTSGQILVADGLLMDARKEFQKALLGRELANDLHGKAITLGNLGRLSMQLGDFESAIKYLSEDIALMKNNDFYNKTIHAQLLSTVSACYVELQNTTDAESFNNESHTINLETNNLTGLAFNYLNSASVALLKNENKDALSFAQKLEELIGHRKIARFLKENLKAKLLQIKAKLLMVEGDTTRAFALFDQALAIFTRERSISDVETARLYLQIAKLARKMKKPALVGQNLRKALRHVDATEEHQLRNEIETEIRASHQDSWILHAAGRFIGHEQISFLLEEAGKGKFTGEERDVVILFSDIRGFTSMSESLRPKELVQMLNGFLSGMTRAVEAYGGFVDKFIGDAVMAVFGLTDTDDGHKTQPSSADKAVMASLTMIEELKRFNRNLPDEVSPLEIGIGLHAGKVIAGLIGSPQKRSYTIIGDAVNTASRLEGMTKMLGAGILVSKEAVTQFTRNDFIQRPLGRFCPKGRLCHVEVFDIMGLDDQSPKLNAIKAECKQAGEALNRFYQRDFAGATANLKALVKQARCSKKARGYKLLLNEAERMKLNPPEDAWQGEVVLVEK